MFLFLKLEVDGQNHIVRSPAMIDPRQGAAAYFLRGIS